MTLRFALSFFLLLPLQAWSGNCATAGDTSPLASLIRSGAEKDWEAAEDMPSSELVDGLVAIMHTYCGGENSTTEFGGADAARLAYALNTTGRLCLGGSDEGAQDAQTILNRVEGALARDVLAAYPLRSLAGPVRVPRGGDVAAARRLGYICPERFGATSGAENLQGEGETPCDAPFISGMNIGRQAAEIQRLVDRLVERQPVAGITFNRRMGLFGRNLFEAPVGHVSFELRVAQGRILGLQLNGRTTDEYFDLDRLADGSVHRVGGGNSEVSFRLVGDLQGQRDLALEILMPGGQTQRIDLQAQGADVPGFHGRAAVTGACPAVQRQRPRILGLPARGVERFRSSGRAQPPQLTVHSSGWLNSTRFEGCTRWEQN